MASWWTVDVFAGVATHWPVLPDANAGPATADRQAASATVVKMVFLMVFPFPLMVFLSPSWDFVAPCRRRRAAAASYRSVDLGLLRVMPAGPEQAGAFGTSGIDGRAEPDACLNARAHGDSPVVRVRWTRRSGVLVGGRARL
ncbi:hypothetical protein BN12_50036 [Nostocoides japonicum T1-X7]|uniref:Uncharacterized protein n=1 Tax=Nostocoides japonicum T1-X7 TaxID=1194083 RepID=A0A077M616_9MICO|nr:hypothetical protein BN12_50036 [Tetrasphaera japonica T1-X7]